MKIALASVLLTATVAHAQDLPEVTSGTLVAQFVCDPATMDVDGSNAVTAWRANNNSSIELAGNGGAVGNIIYDPNDLFKQGGIQVNDTNSLNRSLYGDLGTSLGESTIFWLGYYAPGRDGSNTDSSGSYAYNHYNGSSYISHQSDDGFVEHYSPTRRGDGIGGLENSYQVWTTTIHSSSPGVEMFVNGTNLNVASFDGIATGTGQWFRLFQYSTSNSYGFVGNMHECIIYDGVLSAKDIAAVEAYLEAKRAGGDPGDPCDGDVVECVTPGSPGSPCPPDVSSGTLVANFVTDASTMSLDENNLVCWRAANDPGIVLEGIGTPESNITFDQAALDGLGSLVVNDASSQNRYLMGSIGTGLSNATIFWSGHFNPGQNGSIGDVSGQYVYDLGADGANGTQMDAQIDEDFFEIYGGASTQIGDDISDLNGVYSTWMTKFYANPTTIGHEAYVNGVNLNVPTTTDGYQTDDNLVLFAYQNSGGSGSSGYNFVGNIHQLLIYDGVLDASDAQAVMDYLNCKIASCPGDFDGDYIVDGGDIGLLLAAWGGSSDGGEDINGDGLVDGADLGLLIAGFGPCCP